jgi:peroxiredoxin
MFGQKSVWAVAALGVLTFGYVAMRVSAQDVPKPQETKPEITVPTKAAIDRPFKDFTLRNLSSEKKDEMITLSSFKGKKALVAVFMANRCGTTWTYEERIGKLLQEYAKKDVAIVAIHSNYQESDKEILGQMEQRNLAMPVLDDKAEQGMATYVGARVTPTFLVLDKEGILRYQGAYNRPGDDSREYLRPALDAVLSGKEVAVKTSRAFG